MGNVGKRTAVHNDRRVFKRLNQVGLERVLEQDCHSAVCLQVTGIDRRAVVTIGNQDVAQPPF